MNFRPEHKKSERYADELKKLGMDEDSLEVEVRKFDKEQSDIVKARSIMKALDEEMKNKKDDEDDKKKDDKAMDLDPDAKEVLKNEKEMNNDKKGKDEDYVSKKDFEKAMDSVADIITKKLADYDLSCRTKGKAMDSALSEYARVMGSKPTIAMDSADAVYDSILASNGHKVSKDMTLDVKKGMVSMLTRRTDTPVRNVVVNDSANSLKSREQLIKDFMEA